MRTIGPIYADCGSCWGAELFKRMRNSAGSKLDEQYATPTQEQEAQALKELSEWAETLKASQAQP